MRILIVDDDPVSLTVMSRILNKNGYGTLEAPSVKKAIEYIDAAEPVGLIISDMVMPEMDGLKFLEYASSRPAMQDLRIIMCSAERGRESVLKSIRAGAKDYIVKPIEAGVLLEKVKNVLQSEPPILVDKDWMTARLKMEPETYQEMLVALIRSMTTTLKELPERVAKGEYDQVQCAANGLKGGAVSLGAERIGGVLGRLEVTAQSQEALKIKDALIALQRELTILSEIVSPPETVSKPPPSPSPPSSPA
jgi:twitching motility two-component system response regulator PilH